jgi:NADPH-dependent 2,4-dienoyl-CoA reductase/sulfur reductase-like enzyme
MKKHVLILGAGFAGLELAAQLSESLQDEVRVTLLDQNDSFSFGFSKLDVMLGRRAAEDLRLYYREISLEGVEFRQERVTSIDPEQRRIRTAGGSYDAHVLAVALGADYDFAATPGFREGGHEYYSIAGAERLRDALPEFDSGTILIGILGHPFKCPPAPFEGALLLHDHFVKRGNREAVEIQVIGPMAAPVPVTKELSQAFLDALDARGIEYVPNQLVTKSATGTPGSRAAEACPTTTSSESPSTACPKWSRVRGSQRTAGSRLTGRTWRHGSRASTRWGMWQPCRWPRLAYSPRPPPGSWRRTSPPGSTAANRPSPTRAPAAATSSSAAGW